MSEQEYYIGQIFEDMYPKEAADWCNANNTRIIEIDSITKDVEEEYQSMEEVVVPEQEVDGEIVPEHTESQLVTKTRTVEKTLRRFEIQAIPEPTVDQKKKNIRSVRDSYISGIEWRVSRYRDQVDAGIQTTDTDFSSRGKVGCIVKITFRAVAEIVCGAGKKNVICAQSGRVTGYRCTTACKNVYVGIVDIHTTTKIRSYIACDGISQV